MTVINVSRQRAAEVCSLEYLNSIDNSAPWAWIFIREPDNSMNTYREYQWNDIVSLPTLEISFWDVESYREVPLFGGGNLEFLPPDIVDAKTIQYFLDKFAGHSIVVSCYAGVSRSGAVASFCKNCLGYDWPDQFQRHAHPNKLLFKLLKECQTNNFIK